MHLFLVSILSSLLWLDCGRACVYVSSKQCLLAFTVAWMCENPWLGVVLWWGLRLLIGGLRKVFIGVSSGLDVGDHLAYAF